MTCPRLVENFEPLMVRNSLDTISLGRFSTPRSPGTPPWSPDMSGRVVRDQVVAVRAGRQRVRIPLDVAARAKLAADGSALISFETPDGEVQALDVRLGGRGRR